MFGLISKKKLIKVAVETYLKDDTSQAFSKNDFYFRCGNADALGYLCSKFGINITKEVRKVREREVWK